MKRRYIISPKFFVCLISLFMTLQFALPGSAIKQWRESNLERGWQIWISAADFDKAEGIKPGKSEKKLAGKAQKPWLAEDILIAKVTGGFADYEFESPVAGKAYIWCRVADFRGGGQSWFIVLNSDNIADAGDSLTIDTPGPVWAWKGGRDKPESQSPTDLKKGTNTVRIQPREAEAAKETLFDIFMISTKPFQPTDEDYEKAKEGLPVVPAGKLAITWGTIKSRF